MKAEQIEGQAATGARVLFYSKAATCFQGSLAYHLFKFPPLVDFKGNLSLLKVSYLFSRGLQQMEVGFSQLDGPKMATLQPVAPRMNRSSMTCWQLGHELQRGIRPLCSCPRVSFAQNRWSPRRVLLSRSPSALLPFLFWGRLLK